MNERALQNEGGYGVSRNVTRIPRQSYASISLYAPERPAVDIDLSDNTNQWGAPPSVARTLGEIDPVLVTQYPTQPMLELESQLSQFAGIDEVDAVVTGCGSDDILDCIMRALAEPGDVVAHAQPSFSMIPYFAKTNGLVATGIPFRADWDVDVDAMLQARPRLIYLCAPNNPTGTVIPSRTVRRVLDEFDGVAILDEAYVEFAPESWTSRAAREQNLVVTRTMSKAFGLAGLRLGYAVGAPSLIREISKARGPYKVTALTERIAAEVLRNDREWMESRAQQAVEAREWLRRELFALGLSPLPSAANFLLIPVTDAASIAAKMADRRILLRSFTALPGIGDALRITVAPIPVMLRVVAELRAILAEVESS